MRSGWRTILATAGVYAFAIPGTVVMATLALLSSVVPPRGRASLFFARVWSRCLLAAGGVRVAVEVDPALAAASGGSGFVFLSNHQSYFDIPVIYASNPEPVLFAAKRSLFRIPIFGWSLSAAGFIPVDRQDPSKGRAVFALAARRLRAGLSVLFFPEGTRQREDRLGPFQRGGFLVALKAGLPIVPVGIRGAAQVLHRDRWIVRPGTVHVRYGAPIDTAAYGLGGRRELMAETRRRIAELAGLPVEPDPSPPAVLPSPGDEQRDRNPGLGSAEASQVSRHEP